MLLSVIPSSSPVKGVAWDPVGKYLASAGDDRALLVWRTADWGLEARVTKPFRETAKQETMFRRIAWSPGGDTVVATNASTSKKCVRGGRCVRACVHAPASWPSRCDGRSARTPTNQLTNQPIQSTNHYPFLASRHVAHILKRAGAGESSKGEAAWLTDVTLVGHDRPVTTARFAPVLFQPRPKDGGWLGGWAGWVRAVLWSDRPTDGRIANFVCLSVICTYLQTRQASGGPRRPIASSPRGTRAPGASACGPPSGTAPCWWPRAASPVR